MRPVAPQSSPQRTATVRSASRSAHRWPFRARRASTAALAAVVALALAACGSSANDGADPPTADPPTADPPTAESPATDDTRTVEHHMGTTEVPADPQRVVVLDSPHLDAALSLDVTPVGAVQSSVGDGLPAYLGDRTEGIAIVGTIEEPNLEAIAALDPDLIISATVRHEALYDQLDAIAPTVFSETSGTNWTDQLFLVADALGRRDRAEQLLAEYEDRAAAVGEEVGAADMSASIVRFLPGEIRLYGPETFSGTVLTQVGFDLGDHEWNEYSMFIISPEQIELADADVIFTTTYGPEEDTARGSVGALWDQLEAEKFDVSDDEWMLGIGLIGANIILDDLERLLT